ncbi:hypothetical protein NLU13_8964 [Sarocladium strictum]|uniref:Sialidase n=1 Tax=Sarocladium strictum TaxID=5046 RepID=A0AA39G995_SARSR|nr:hypothetical protein NLU13_8964 [Sarocladium strictum]
MSALEADIAFDFSFPSESIEHPSSPPFMPFIVDTSSHNACNNFLDLPFSYTYPAPAATHSHGHGHGHGHARSSSHSSVYSIFSNADSINTTLTTPPPARVVTPQPHQRRSTPPVRQHGPLLLPKIRSQDQDLDAGAVITPAQQSRASSVMATPPPAPRQQQRGQKRKTPSSSYRPVVHNRSYTNPETLNSMAFAHMSSFTGLPTPSPSPEDRHQQQQQQQSSLLLCSPASFAHDTTTTPHPSSHLRRASSCSSVDVATVEKYGYPTYRQMPFLPSAATTPQPEFHLTGTPEPITAPAPSTTTLINYLTSANPAPCLVRTVAFPLRDPQIKHFWWDVRNVSSWSSFTASHIFSLPGASSLLTTPIPSQALNHNQNLTSRHPENEAQLHSIFASYYLPKINSALACSSTQPVQLSVSKSCTDLLFTANINGEPTAAASIFGGKPTARAVGLVRSFERFNTQMRTEGNIKRVEYLRGLAALHHAMREHNTRYGFILTEIELVLVRNGTEATPYFGDLEITSVDLSADGQTTAANGSSNLTACLALWGLCQMISGDEPAPGQAHWRADIGAPAEGTRRKAKPRDKWMPQPQLAEKREAKRSRGWIMPEDAVGRKELGKRGVRYGNI